MADRTLAISSYSPKSRIADVQQEGRKLGRCAPLYFFISVKLLTFLHHLETRSSRFHILGHDSLWRMRCAVFYFILHCSPHLRLHLGSPQTICPLFNLSGLDLVLGALFDGFSPHLSSLRTMCPVFDFSASLWTVRTSPALFPTTWASVWTLHTLPAHFWPA